MHIQLESDNFYYLGYFERWGSDSTLGAPSLSWDSDGILFGHGTLSRDEGHQDRGMMYCYLLEKAYCTLRDATAQRDVCGVSTDSSALGAPSASRRQYDDRFWPGTPFLHSEHLDGGIVRQFC